MHVTPSTINNVAKYNFLGKNSVAHHLHGVLWAMAEILENFMSANQI